MSNKFALFFRNKYHDQNQDNTVHFDV